MITRKVQKNGKSLQITIPTQLASILKLEHGCRASFKISGKTLEIELYE